MRAFDESLFVPYSSGTQIGRLTYGESDPTWITTASTSPIEQRYPVCSPDHTQIAYLEWGSGNGNIWVVSAAAGGDETEVYHYNDPGNPGIADEVKWSPDGTELWFTIAPTNDKIYKIDADGSNLTTVYTDPSGRSVHGIGFNYDGTKVSFQVLLSATSLGNWTMDIDGTNAQQASTGPTQSSIIGGNTCLTPWANTQNTIAYKGGTLAAPTVRTVDYDGTNDTLLGSVRVGFTPRNQVWTTDDAYVFYYLNTPVDIRRFNSDGSGDSLVKDDWGSSNADMIVLNERLYVANGDVYSMLADGSDYTQHTSLGTVLLF